MKNFILILALLITSCEIYAMNNGSQDNDAKKMVTEDLNEKKVSDNLNELTLLAARQKKHGCIFCCGKEQHY